MSAHTIIRQLGGTAAVARLCQCEPQAVSQWKKNGIPKARLMFLRLAKPEIDWSALNEEIAEAA